MGFSHYAPDGTPCYGCSDLETVEVDEYGEVVYGCKDCGRTGSIDELLYGGEE